MEEELEVVSVLADLCHRDRTPLANAVLRVFRYEKKEAMLLKTMNDREIQIEGKVILLILLYTIMKNCAFLNLYICMRNIE